jgi:hypothetical protein
MYNCLIRALCLSSLVVYTCAHSTYYYFPFQGLKCLFDDAVKEVMWGLQNLMHTLVPQEQSKITKDDRLPMSLGLNMVFNRYKINVTQEMVSLLLVLLLFDMQCFLFYPDLFMQLPCFVHS